MSIWNCLHDRSVFFINFTPVIVFHFLMLPIWLLSEILPSLWVVTIISQIASTFVLPYFIVEWNELYNLKKGKREFVSNWLLASLSTMVSFLLSYMNWGLTSRNLLNPDSETILILKWELAAALILVFVWSVLKQIRYIRKDTA